MLKSGTAWQSVSGPVELTSLLGLLLAGSQCGAPGLGLQRAQMSAPLLAGGAVLAAQSNTAAL
ncbi:hypothetical protein PF005_g20832 [Phytophthora fragariae]|uniref:Uncharacterized protein n=1 Tax=Phytophthora fragariae TaxID=53985 RepID=A0A6A3E6I3_9STRA|nr:hypothetical protein PF003_g12224 [Phytophthora fragariae]KAE8927966.1 hypothetical protein PF009_g21874 [Phytophthora fragariae]KAE8987656.1 hypothetical protein PF011_g19490 [Phytophthora fragariae]KAE9089413.1 hypothetical protein PF007_g19606 [Phytophthora fragariae]KAE9089631.1 hypothetical protein PF010_g18911 [Phytophthora fragariae]